MKERGKTFTGPEIRAIQDGSKTQFRDRLANIHKRAEGEPEEGGTK